MYVFTLQFSSSMSMSVHSGALVACSTGIGIRLSQMKLERSKASSVEAESKGC
jgi:hypothetical protein